MSRPTESRQGPVMVEYWTFIVSGLGDIGAPSALKGDIIAASYMPGVGPDAAPSDVDWLYIESGGSDHQAWVTAELWNQPPDCDPDNWEAVTTLVATAVEGHIRIGRLTASPDDWQLPLPNGRYNLRVHSRGRDTVHEAMLSWIDELSATGISNRAENVEEYLIQLWSAEH